MLLRKIVSLAVPTSVALAAFLHAHAIGALVDAAATPSSIAPFAEARAAATGSGPPGARSASAILERNPFDHETGALLREQAAALPGGDASDPRSAPPCAGVRAVASVLGEEPDAAFAALDVGGKSHLGKRGGSIADMRVVYVAADRVWLERNGALCQARLFAAPGEAAPPPSPEPGAAPAPPASALARELAGKIAKTGPNEFQIDRGAMDRILEAQTELMKTPLAPEKEGDRVVGFRLVRVRPGSVLATLGLETNDRLVSINGIEVTSTERMVEAYAKLRSGTIERLTLHVVRAGKPTNIDYVVR
ncbi:MAG: hypothetical protein KF764_23050 [Labilithrix sp.]|nr:hypothetical protein [Labilithrix sp.]